MARNYERTIQQLGGVRRFMAGRGRIWVHTKDSAAYVAKVSAERKAKRKVQRASRRANR